jgi:16S rRNA (cytosine967-C5)-methyltransferase
VKPGVPVRVEAARSLDRILRTGAYSNVVVHQTDLMGADRSAHQSLVFTALRWILPIDVRIAEATDRPLERLEPLVLSVLRVATAESMVLGREPHGVVDSAVEAIDVLGIGRAKGLVNAVSRSIANSNLPRPGANEAFPEWMVTRACETFNDGSELLASLNEAAPVGVRLRKGEIDSITPVPDIPRAGYVSGSMDVGELEREGAIDVIDPASTAVALSLGVEPGMAVLDLAAAPGGKTRAMADDLRPADHQEQETQGTGELSGFIVASDVHRTRVSSAARRTKDFDTIRWLRSDALAPPVRPKSFHRVLLDAPCTGLGSLRRRPEIRYRIDPEAPSGYGAKQRQMLERAIELVRPGGRLVYSVCTIFPEETVDVVARLGGHPPDGLGGRVFGDGVLLNPLDTGTDGMFICVFDKSAN